MSRDQWHSRYAYLHSCLGRGGQRVLLMRPVLFAIRERVRIPDGGAGGRGRDGWPRRVAVAAGHTGCRGPLRAAGRHGRGTAKKRSF